MKLTVVPLLPHVEFAGSMICERNTSPSRAGEIAAGEVISNVQQGACLDEFLTDQVNSEALHICVVWTKNVSTVQCTWRVLWENVKSDTC